MKTLSVIVPVFNEEKTVGGIISKLDKINLGKRRKEIVVVDDGSGDGSAGIIKKLKIKNLKFIRHKKNQGKGAAIRTALKKATGDYVIIQDADTEYNPDEIIKLVSAAEKQNLLVVFGSRDKEIRNRYLYPHYYWGSKMLCVMLNLMFGEKFTDPETCYKLIQTDLMRFLEISERGFGVEMEMAAKIARLKVPYDEVSISYHPRSFAEGKKIGMKDGFEAIFLIWKYWQRDLHFGIGDRILRQIRLGETLKYLNFSKGDVVVDMGCGRQASLGWRLRPKVKRYLGLDMDVPAVGMENINLVTADLDRKIKLNTGSADKIIGAAIFEHLRKPETFLKECRRILKTGGILALTTPAPPLADLILKICLKLKVVAADEVYDHVGYYSLKKLGEMLVKSGFELEKTKGFLFGLNNLIVAKKP